jgi:hypothetical protein
MRGLIGNNEVFKSLKSGLMRSDGLRMPVSKGVFEPKKYTLIPPDPHATSVILHIKGDGVEGSTAIVDSSGRNKTLNRAGTIRISTAQSVYGGSSLYMDGNNAYLEIPYDADFNLPGQFTIEAWVWKINQGSYQTIFELGYYYNGILFRPHSTGSGEVYINSNTSLNSFTAKIGLNKWTHIALTRDSGNIIRLFFDGIFYNSITLTGSLNTGSVITRIGCSSHTTGQCHAGYIDSFRITKGVCRYTANFDPMDDFATYLNYVVV